MEGKSLYLLKKKMEGNHLFVRTYLGVFVKKFIKSYSIPSNSSQFLGERKFEVLTCGCIFMWIVALFVTVGVLVFLSL